MRLVHKFGGTSLGSPSKLKQVVDIVRQSDTHENYIVVSAFSFTTKKQGTTSKLLEALQLAHQGVAYQHLIELLYENHASICKEIITDVQSLQKIISAIEAECQQLDAFLQQIHSHTLPYVLLENKIVSLGEKLASLILTDVLEYNGIPSRSIDLSDIYPIHEAIFEQGDPPSNFFNNMENLLYKRVEPVLNQEIIPVITGYIGDIPGGILQKIGRGYSDFTASLVASTIKADELWIWKDVNGIYTADPNWISSAKLIDYITPQEVAELTYFGSEVMHPFTMGRAIRAHIPIRIRNTISPDIKGTLVLSSNIPEETKKSIKSVTVKAGIQLVMIQSNQLLSHSDFLSMVFNLSKQYRLIVYLIHTSGNSLSLAIENNASIEPFIKELSIYGSVQARPDHAIVSIIGYGVRNQTNLASIMLNVLTEADIPVEMLSTGASKVNISCIIPENSAKDALSVLHKYFIEETESLTHGNANPIKVKFFNQRRFRSAEKAVSSL